MQKDRRLSYLIGFVSLFYWMSTWFVPPFRLVNERGHPVGGLGILFSIFNERGFIIVVLVLTVSYLITISSHKTLVNRIIASLMFGVWVMLATSYLIISWWQMNISPNLVLTIGYCCAIWINLTAESRG